jgi:hypothetical protein
MTPLSKRSFTVRNKRGRLQGEKTVSKRRYAVTDSMPEMTHTGKKI